MKNYIIIILTLIPFLTNGQDYKLNSNDSVKIYQILQKSNNLIVIIGNQNNGLERIYKKINGEYFMTSITYWKDNQFIWRSLTSYDKDIKFYLSNFKLNHMTKKENMDIVIPYETGLPWVKIIVENYEIVSCSEYFRNGKLKDEYQFQNEDILDGY